jgi:SAM-dependent methyltransferase
MSTSVENDQTKIWDHFQGPGLSSFDKAVPRLRYLFGRARHLARGHQWRVLNIGTGNGWLERACHSHGWATSSLDPSMVALQLVGRHGIPGQVGLIERTPYRDGSFDAVFCSEVIEHLTPEQMAHGLREIRRVLRAGGYLIGTVPFDEDLERGETVCPECGTVFHRWGHRQSFTAASMRAHLAAAELAPLEAEPRAFPYFAERTAVNTTKAVAAKLLGRLGMQAAFPSLCFIATKGER